MKIISSVFLLCFLCNANIELSLFPPFATSGSLIYLSGNFSEIKEEVKLCKFGNLFAKPVWVEDDEVRCIAPSLENTAVSVCLAGAKGECLTAQKSFFFGEPPYTVADSDSVVEPGHWIAVRGRSLKGESLKCFFNGTSSSFASFKRNKGYCLVPTKFETFDEGVLVLLVAAHESDNARPIIIPFKTLRSSSKVISLRERSGSPGTHLQIVVDLSKDEIAPIYLACQFGTLKISPFKLDRNEKMTFIVPSLQPGPYSVSVNVNGKVLQPTFDFFVEERDLEKFKHKFEKKNNNLESREVLVELSWLSWFARSLIFFILIYWTWINAKALFSLLPSRELMRRKEWEKRE